MKKKPKVAKKSHGRPRLADQSIGDEESKIQQTTVNLHDVVEVFPSTSEDTIKSTEIRRWIYKAESLHSVQQRKTWPDLPDERQTPATGRSLQDAADTILARGGAILVEEEVRQFVSNRLDQHLSRIAESFALQIDHYRSHKTASTNLPSTSCTAAAVDWTFATPITICPSLTTRFRAFAHQLKAENEERIENPILNPKKKPKIDEQQNEEEMDEGREEIFSDEKQNGDKFYFDDEA